MRFQTLALFGALASSSLCYMVTFPTEFDGWGNSGSQLLSWNTVNTDPDSFAVVLDNQVHPNLLSRGPVVLGESIMGSEGNIFLDPPSQGWTVGDGYRLNLVKSASEIHTIYAQSNQFNITSGSGSPTPTGTSTAKIGTNTFGSSGPRSAAGSGSHTATGTAHHPPPTNEPLVAASSGDWMIPSLFNALITFGALLTTVILA